MRMPRLGELGNRGGYTDANGKRALDCDANIETFEWPRTDLVEPGRTYGSSAATDRKRHMVSGLAAGSVSQTPPHAAPPRSPKKCAALSATRSSRTSAEIASQPAVWRQAVLSTLPRHSAACPDEVSASPSLAAAPPGSWPSPTPSCARPAVTGRPTPTRPRGSRPHGPMSSVPGPTTAMRSVV